MKTEKPIPEDDNKPGELGGDYARDTHREGFGDDYARDSGWSGGGTHDQYTRDEQPAKEDDLGVRPPHS